MARRGSVSVLPVAVAAVVVACAPATGQGPTVSPEARVVELSITADARFAPDRIAVKTGETIRFVVDNPTLPSRPESRTSGTASSYRHTATASSSTTSLSLARWSSVATCRATMRAATLRP